MSYSFTVRANKLNFTQVVNDELAKVCEGQPIHQRDRDAAINAVQGLVGIIHVPEGKALNIAVSGSVGWEGEFDLSEDRGPSITAAGLNISITTVDVPKDAQAEGAVLTTGVSGKTE